MKVTINLDTDEKTISFRPSARADESPPTFPEMVAVAKAALGDGLVTMTSGRTITFRVPENTGWEVVE